MKRLVCVVVAALLTGPVFGQSSVPTGTEVGSAIEAAGVAAGAAAALGLSLWVYRKIKAKASEALGDGWDTPEGRAELAANEEAKKTGQDWL